MNLLSIWGNLCMCAEQHPYPWPHVALGLQGVKDPRWEASGFLQCYARRCTKRVQRGGKAVALRPPAIPCRLLGLP